MVTDTPVPGKSRQDHTGTSGIKKKIEISRPIKKITVDTSHLPPKPVETTSLPEGSFCGRCGNRIPPGSTFCNRCGTKVVVPGDDMAVSAAPGQITMAPAVASGPGDRKGRPIEQIIHSIEPLIEDSVPRTEAAPAVPEPAAAQPAEPVPAPATPADVFAAAAAAVAGMGQDALSAPPAGPVPPLPPVPSAPRKKRRKILAAAIIIVVILLVVAGGFVAMNTLHKTAVVTPVVTPVPTTEIPTPTVTPTAVPTTVVTTDCRDDNTAGAHPANGCLGRDHVRQDLFRPRRHTGYATGSV